MGEEPNQSAAERQPVTHEASSTLTLGVQTSASGVVKRGLNEMRLAVLGILVSISLAVGFGISGPWQAKLLAGLGSFAVSCLLIRWAWTRHLLMAFMHWLTRA
jgi:hypothetical protein